ncbi:MAG: hypothetical protein AAF919_07355 [Pseudomonadota bacterium]
MSTVLRRLSLTLLIALLASSALVRLVSASLATVPQQAQEAAPAVAALCPPSEDVSALLRDIARRSDALAAQEADLALREQDHAIARQEITAALEDMAAAEARLEARMFQSNAASEDDVARLTAVYEGMKAKDAAVLFEAMAPEFAAGFLGRLKPDVAAAIMAGLTPERAYALSVILAGRNANAAREGGR